MAKTLVIDDEFKDNDILFPSGVGRGYVPRDFSQSPPSMFSPPSDIPLVPEHEWESAIKEQESKKSSLSHLWQEYENKHNTILHLDQNGQGFCWSYSTHHTIMATYIRENEPCPRLSAHAVACKIMNFQDRGGWCGLSAEFIRENGCLTVDEWKEQSMSRAYDTKENWERAKKRRIVEDFVDLSAPHYYYQKLTFAQVVSCLLLNNPCALDFDWWGHSVCGLRAVVVERGSIGIEIVNSWKLWGDKGRAVLRGSKAYPNSAICTRLVGSINNNAALVA